VAFAGITEGTSAACPFPRQAPFLGQGRQGTGNPRPALAPFLSPMSGHRLNDFIVPDQGADSAVQQRQNAFRRRIVKFDPLDPDGTHRCPVFLPSQIGANIANRFPDLIQFRVKQLADSGLRAAILAGVGFQRKSI